MATESLNEFVNQVRQIVTRGENTRLSDGGIAGELHSPWCCDSRTRNSSISWIENWPDYRTAIEPY